METAADLLVVKGDLNLDLNDGTTIFALINYTGTWNGGLFTYGSSVLSDGARFMVGSQQWEIDYDRTSSAGLATFTGDYLANSSFVAITAVPEPSTLALGGLGVALLAVAAWRRRLSAAPGHPT